MLVILLSLIVGFVIANETNKKSLKFILTYSLLSFIIIVFIFQKSCKKCKINKNCTIEKFDEKEKQNNFKKNLLKFITELTFFSKLFKTNKTKEIKQKKINEICDKIKKSKKLSLIYFNAISKNSNAKVKNDIFKNIRNKVMNKFKHLDKKEFEKKKKEFLKIMNMAANKQRRKAIKSDQLNMPYINYIIKDTSHNLQNYIISKNKTPCNFE